MSNKKEKLSNTDFFAAGFLPLITLLCFHFGDIFFLIGLILIIPTINILTKVFFNEYFNKHHK